MYTIQRNPDPDEPAGVATPPAEKTETTQSEPEGGQTDEVVADPAAVELDENDFNFDEPEANDDPANPKRTIAGITPTSQAATEGTVSKKEYEILAEKLAEANNTISQLTSRLNNPLMKAVIEYEQVIGEGVEINPSDFVRNYFGVEADAMSAEDLIKLQIQDEARQAGVQMSEDDFERTFNKRFDAFEDKDDLAKAVEIKRLKDERKRVAKEKQDQLIGTKLEDRKKGEQFWQDAYEKGVVPILVEFKETKKKTFGLKETLDESKIAAINVALSNNFYRFNPDGSLNYKHAIETAHFSIDQAAYVKKIEERAIARHKLQNIKDGAPGAGLPSSIAQGKKTEGTISASPSDINSLKGATVVKF